MALNYADAINEQTVNCTVESSLLSGYNNYFIPLYSPTDRPFFCRHVNSGVIVRIQPASLKLEQLTKGMLRWIDDLVLNPIHSRNFDWPSDLISYSDQESKNETVAFVFVDRGIPAMEPLRNIVFQSKIHNKVTDWRNRDTMELLYSVLEAEAKLQAHGYVYLNYDLNRILFDANDKSVFFRFTTAIRDLDPGNDDYDAINPEELAPEFTAPFLYRDDYDGQSKLHADCYALTAFLFRMMIGRMPYEGIGMESIGLSPFDPGRDRDWMLHQSYFEKYHRYPHFIFHPTDRVNKLSPTSDDDLPRERWNSLPEKIRESFITVLGEENADRGDGSFIGAAEWLELLKNELD